MALLFAIKDYYFISRFPDIRYFFNLLFQPTFQPTNFILSGRVVLVVMGLPCFLKHISTLKYTVPCVHIQYCTVQFGSPYRIVAHTIQHPPFFLVQKMETRFPFGKHKRSTSRHKASANIYRKNSPFLVRQPIPITTTKLHITLHILRHNILFCAAPIPDTFFSRGYRYRRASSSFLPYSLQYSYTIVVTFHLDAYAHKNSAVTYLSFH